MEGSRDLVKKLAILTMAGVLFFITASSASAASPPALRGKAILLMDGLTGQVLYQQAGAEKNYPASTTKLLTALVAVEHFKLDQKIRVSKQAVSKAPDSASCYISEGEEHPLEYLLYGLLLRSGNDCADAIAEGVTGGNPQQFIVWMNETARRLGATNSHFVNPHGLHDANHYTTAIDLALIARGALANPVVRRIATTRSFDWPGKESNGTYYNGNDMLLRRDDVIGGKTGFTEEARYTLVVAAEQNGRQLIGVTLGWEHKQEELQDMEALLDYGFANFVTEEAVKAGSPLGEVPVADGKTASVPVIAESSFSVSRPRDGHPKVTIVPRLKSGLKAPVTQGQNVGVLEIREGDQLLGTVPVVTREAVEARPQFWARVGQWTLAAVKWIVILFASLLVFRTVVKALRRILRRRRGAGGILRDRVNGTRGEITSYRTRSGR